MRPVVYDYQDYRRFLKDALLGQNSARGRQSELARYLACQSSFVSQVLTNRAHLSLEHAPKVARYFGLAFEEEEFFLLLLQQGRAGTKELEQFFGKQIAARLKDRQLVKERIKIKDKISAEDEAIYYSMWYYGAIHILAAFPDVNDVDAIVAKLQLPRAIVVEAVEFLLHCGLVVRGKNGLDIGKARIHLGSDSPLVARHHLNWREQLKSYIERREGDNLHYSGLIGITKKDAAKLRAMLLDFVENTEGVIKNSDAEAPFLLCLDFVAF
jgi:plasmid maintenance system antidote protein VapI